MPRLSLGLRSIEDFLHYVGQPRAAVLHARRTAEGGCPPRYRETSSSVGCGTSFVDEARTRWMASARASASFSRSLETYGHPFVSALTLAIGEPLRKMRVLFESFQRRPECLLQHVVLRADHRLW